MSVLVGGTGATLIYVGTRGFGVLPVLYTSVYIYLFRRLQAELVLILQGKTEIGNDDRASNGDPNEGHWRPPLVPLVLPQQI